RPQHLRIEADEGQAPEPSSEAGSPARAVVTRARFLGHESLIECRMDHDASLIKATVPHAWLPDPGSPVWLSLPRARCFVFPSAEQSRVASPWAAE
ncbi:MAG: TOBE domain-containing protein, partial [Pseudomonadota bacterium]